MSNYAFKSRTDILENVLEQVMEELASSHSHLAYSMMKTLMFLTAVSSRVSCVISMAIKLKKNFCLGEPLLKTAKASDVFRIVHNFLPSKIVTEKRDWARCARMEFQLCSETNPVLPL